MEISETLMMIADFRKSNRTAARVAYYNRHTNEHASLVWGLWMAVSELPECISRQQWPYEFTARLHIEGFLHFSELFLGECGYRLPPDGAPQLRSSKAGKQLREMKSHVSPEEYLRMARLAVAVCEAQTSAHSLIPFIALQDTIMEA